MLAPPQPAAEMGPRPPRRESFDLFAYNREAWDHQVELGDRWTTPVDADTIARARSGELEVGLTPIRPVPPTWLPSAWPGLAVLGLGSGGGQQCPLFAAAGADVTSVDASPRQLSRDREVAEREGLSLRTLEADMRDLSLLEDASFDLVFHPVSNCFVTDVRPVWREAARVLKPGGHLLAGFIQPLYFLFDDDKLDRGEFEVRFRIPYRDDEALDSASLDAVRAQREPLLVGHTLEDQIGGQCAAGLNITDFYEDRWGGKPLDDRIATFGATRSVKLG